MSKDQAIGAILLIGCIVGILVYGWLVFASQWAFLTLQITGFIAVAGVLAILAWIGYTLATTPPPKPIEDIEKEIEEELKKLEKGTESKQGTSEN
ncbi:MAG: transcriptional regulator [Nitrososphaerota archaeon]|nr:transcriptional regulator [Candidatus Bathyarchaeota archaeon]MCX8161732.1 transcriptional regulator [Candidatus Bathyarchaeota archaeon]MDW8062501.1 transcriptional regulator [Nitrososphaerota archaeon]